MSATSKPVWTDPYYKACVGMATAGGGVAGNILGGVGAAPTAGLSLAALPLAGAAMGFAAGYLACPYLAPGLREKLNLGALLSEAEVKDAASAMGKYAGVSSVQDAVRLVAVVRAAAAGAKGAPVCGHPRAEAALILKGLPARV